MVESVGKVGVGRVDVCAGSRIVMGDAGRAKRVGRRSNRLASAINGCNASSIPSRRSSINKLLALSFWYRTSFSNSLVVH